MTEQILDRREFLLRSAAIAAGTSCAPALRATAGSDEGGDDAHGPRDAGRRGRGLADTSASPHVVGAQRRPGRRPVDRGLLGRSIRGVPGRHGPQPVAGHGGHGTEPVLSQLPRSRRAWPRADTAGRPGTTATSTSGSKRPPRVYAVAKDAALDRRMDEVIGVIARAQRGDGYLHTPVLIKNRERRRRRASRSRTGSTSRRTTSAT